MAKLLDPSNLLSQKAPLPGMKPPVRDFAPTDDGDPAEVDAFNEMIRELRDQGSTPGQAQNESASSRHERRFHPI
jgi:hypothetical protein